MTTRTQRPLADFFKTAKAAPPVISVDEIRAVISQDFGPYVRMNWLFPVLYGKSFASYIKSAISGGTLMLNPRSARLRFVMLIASVIIIASGIIAGGIRFQKNQAQGHVFLLRDKEKGGSMLEGWKRYDYRMLRYQYDSFQLEGIYGEFTLMAGRDSVLVPFEGPSIDYLGKDSSLDFINSITKTMTFPVGDYGSLYFVRAITMGADSSDYYNEHLVIPDTCIWTAELFNIKKNRRLATLDSITTFPVFYRSRVFFPPIGPDSTSARIIRIDLRKYHFKSTDSAYIKIRMSKRGNGKPTFNIGGMEADYYKFSDAQKQAFTQSRR